MTMHHFRGKRFLLGKRERKGRPQTLLEWGEEQWNNNTDNKR